MERAAGSIRFICSHCKTAHILTRDEVSGLPESVTFCRSCKKSIKISFCPKCGTSYSITFSSPMNRKYTLNCRHCGTIFPVEFPFIRGAIPKQPVSAPVKTEMDSVNERPHHAPPVKSSIIIEETPVSKPDERIRITSLPRTGRSIAVEVLQFFTGVFGVQKLIISAVAAVSIFILMAVSYRVEHMLLDIPLFRENAFLLHLLNFLSVFAFSFVFILSNTVIARLSMPELPGHADMKTGEIAAFTSARALPVLTCNIAVLLAFNSLLIAFGSIPLVGPILYSLLFLPVYLFSVATVILCAIAVWFYPPVLAVHGGIITSVREFIYFIRRHHFNLLITIPLLAILTAVFIALLNVIHYSSLSLALGLSRGLLGDEINRILLSMPHSASGILNIPHMIQGVKALPSMLGNLIFSYHVGGIILGAALGTISIALLSVILSFTGTLSARAYIMLEQGREPGGSRKIETLAVLFLVLAVLYMAKKVFL